VWIASIYGWYSVSALSNDRVQVRARLKSHLRKLKRRFELPQRIIETTYRDYRYRIVMPKEQWVWVVSEIAREQTWGNFKDEAAIRNPGRDGDEYLKALHKVWNTMHGLQLHKRMEDLRTVRK
jgi:hypothetical protein